MASSRYIEKLANRLFSNQVECEAFIDNILKPKKYPNALIWLEARSRDFEDYLNEREKWQPSFVDRVKVETKLGNTIFHENGEIYLLDFSSIFEASVLAGIDGHINQVLDVCSAPGGKAIFAWRLIKPKLILCNEVIHKRCKALISNLKRCKVNPVGVTGYDSSILSNRYESCFDLVVVDAPCSGQSLLAKGEDNPGAFHPLTIKRNASRQRRIIANSQNCVSPGGYMAYMTCTYSIEENEGVIEWFLKKFPEFNVIEVESLRDYLSPYSAKPCYRIWPQSGLGAGGFTVLLKREGKSQPLEIDLQSQRFFWKSYNE